LKFAIVFILRMVTWDRIVEYFLQKHAVNWVIYIHTAQWFEEYNVS
jgi:hypothetical protein